MKAKLFTPLLAPLALLVLLSGCGGDDAADSAPQYGRAFPQDRVSTLELTISAADWQAMLGDLTGKLGAFGSGGGGGGGGPGGPIDPQAPIAACAGKAEGDACSFTVMGTPLDGTCVTQQATLSCRPAGGPGGGGPGGGGPGGGGGGLVEIDPIYVPCTVRFEGETWEHVGVRFKGNSSLISSWSGGVNKLPLRLKFDELEEQYPETSKQRFFGFRTLSLSNGWSDASLVRDKLGTDVFAEAGFAVPATAFYRVVIDHGEGPIYFGLYTAIEVPSDKAFLRTHFDSADGNLYKPDGQGASFAVYDEATLGKENHEEAADYSDVRALYDALHADRSDASAWRAALEQTLEVDGFLRWLAYNAVMQDWDTYGQMTHNYYLYNAPANGRLTWIPWDHTFAFNESGGVGGGGGGGGGQGRSRSLSMAEVTDQWPLIRWLLDDATYLAAYQRYLREAVETVYEPGRAQARFAAARALIEPHVVGEAGEQPGYTHLSSAAAFAEAHAVLQAHPGRRAQAVTDYLAP